MVSHGQRQTRMHKLAKDDTGALFFLYPHDKRPQSDGMVPFEWMPDDKLASIVSSRGLQPKADRNMLLFQAKGDEKMRTWMERHKTTEEHLHSEL